MSWYEPDQELNYHTFLWVSENDNGTLYVRFNMPSLRQLPPTSRRWAVTTFFGIMRHEMETNAFAFSVADMDTLDTTEIECLANLRFCDFTQVFPRQYVAFRQCVGKFRATIGKHLAPIATDDIMVRLFAEDDPAPTHATEATDITCVTSAMLHEN
jgi:hypothetical protein